MTIALWSLGYLAGVFVTAFAVSLFDGDGDWEMVCAMFWPIGLPVVAVFGLAMTGMFIADLVRGRVK